MNETLQQFAIPSLAFTVVVDALLAWRIWIGNSKNKINIYFALAVFLAAMWALGLLGVWIFNSPLYISLSVRLSYLGGALSGFFFLLFSYYFPYVIIRVPKYAFTVLIYTTVSICIISVWPDLFLASLVYPEVRFLPVISIFWNIIYALYFFLVVPASFIILYKKYKISDGIWRKRIRQVVIATTVAFAGGSFFSLILPFKYSNSIDWIGPIFTLFMAVYIWFTIFLKRIPKES